MVVSLYSVVVTQSCQVTVWAAGAGDGAPVSQPAHVFDSSASIGEDKKVSSSVSLVKIPMTAHKSCNDCGEKNVATMGKLKNLQRVQGSRLSSDTSSTKKERTSSQSCRCGLFHNFPVFPKSARSISMILTCVIVLA